MAGSKRTPLTIQDLLAGSLDLASPPEVFLKVSACLDDPAKNAHDAARIIETDPGLTARLLRIVNSAIYGLTSKIYSIAHGITIIGAEELRQLVLATVVVERFSSLPKAPLTMRDFWRASVRCALFARALALRHPERRSLSIVFTCAILHEIGQLVLFHRVPELARAALLRADSESIAITRAEEQELGFNHYQVGAALADRWNLPPVIGITIGYHEHPQQAPDHILETTLVSLAACLQKDSETLTSPLVAAALTQLGLDEYPLETLTEVVEAEFEEIFQLIFHG